ncbi:MAG: DnaJ domain-containing protein, partial [Nitrosopumilus sp.]
TKENSEEEMTMLNKAYEVLSDKESRERYDRYLKVG